MRKGPGWIRGKGIVRSAGELAIALLAKDSPSLALIGGECDR
jgi:hypothetical protein